MEEVLNNLMGDEEYNSLMREAIAESEMGEWLYEDVIAKFENGDDMEPENLLPLAKQYAENYSDVFQEYEIFSEIPNEAFKPWFTWSLIKYMKKCINKYTARIDAYNASEDIEDRWERNHVYDRVYEDRSNRPLFGDEIMDMIINSKESEGVQLK